MMHHNTHRSTKGVRFAVRCTCQCITPAPPHPAGLPSTHLPCKCSGYVCACGQTSTPSLCWPWLGGGEEVRRSMCDDDGLDCSLASDGRLSLWLDGKRGWLAFYGALGVCWRRGSKQGGGAGCVDGVWWCMPFEPRRTAPHVCTHARTFTLHPDRQRLGPDA